jgi:hypothetical protein
MMVLKGAAFHDNITYSCHTTTGILPREGSPSQKRIARHSYAGVESNFEPLRARRSASSGLIVFICIIRFLRSLRVTIHHKTNKNSKSNPKAITPWFCAIVGGEYFALIRRGLPQRGR